jgi:hypothetical protein
VRDVTFRWEVHLSTFVLELTQTTTTMLRRFLIAATLLAAQVTAAPLLALRATSQGCGKAQTAGYKGPITIQSGGRTRSFKIQVSADDGIIPA